MKRILAVGHIGPQGSTLWYLDRGWIAEESTHRPRLSRAERAGLEAFWPTLGGPEYTEAQCTEWFNERFAKERNTHA